MNFVYICRGGQNEELRYSIRSVVEFFPDADIWVVGGIPTWYKGKKISIEQNVGKWPNAINNINAIVDSKNIPEEFVFMNDDFFIVNKPDFTRHYHEGPLFEKLERYRKIKMDPNYIKKLGSTYAKLERMGIENPNSYETHTPMVMLKSRLGEVMQYCPPNLWRSLYGNIHQVGGEQIVDVKVYYRDRFLDLSYDYLANKTFPFISTDDESFIAVKESILKNKFSKKTKFER